MSLLHKFGEWIGVVPLHDVDLPDDPTGPVAQLMDTLAAIDIDAVEERLVETIAVLQAFVDGIRAGRAEPQLTSGITDLSQRRRKGRQP